MYYSEYWPLPPGGGWRADGAGLAVGRSYWLGIDLVTVLQIQDKKLLFDYDYLWQVIEE